jgi:hypothetical protein
VRKRIVIGLLILSAIGTGVYLTAPSEPKKGSVEWHKQEYLAARNGNSAMFRLRSVWSRVTGDKFYTANYRYRSEGMQSNRTALIRLGYLTERTFVISNRPTREVISNAWFNVSTNIDADFIRVEARRGTNIIEVSTVSGDIPKWEEAIRKADVP